MPPQLSLTDFDSTPSLRFYEYEYTKTFMEPDGGTIVGLWTRVVGSPPSSSTTPPVRFIVLTRRRLKQIGGGLEALGVICI
jgi:hypothetical protein